MDNLLSGPDWACQLERLTSEAHRGQQQQRHYGLLWIENLASGSLELDFVHYQLQAQQVVFWAPGQICRIELKDVTGWRLDFGLDTLCQSGLNDSLLGDLGLFAPLTDSPLLNIPESEQHELSSLWQSWARDNSSERPYQRQLSASYLRLMLLRCARLKSPQIPTEAPPPELWTRFRELLEINFRSWHQVSDYASQLAVTPGHLNDLVKQACGRSAKQLIQERVMLEARRSAWFSQASLKEIAYDLGFEDPAYFSRLFRRCSGQNFSDFRASIREMSRA